MIAPHMIQIAMEMKVGHVCSCEALKLQVGCHFSPI